MLFKTAFNRGETTESPLGSEFAPIYSYRIDKKTGKKILEKTGETNLYEKIQASHEGTKLENIIKKVTVTGDLTPLNIREGTYIDISDVPTNLIEIQNTMLKAKDQFYQLDAETRAKFDNSVEKYISTYGSEEWMKNLNLLEEIKEEIKEEVKEEGKENE